MTPFQLMFGRTPRTAVDVAVDTVPQHLPLFEWQERMDRARELAANRSGLARGLRAPEDRVAAEDEF